MITQFNRTVEYTGPTGIDFATCTGSPLWGLSVQQVTEAAIARGWQHVRDYTNIQTPYITAFDNGVAPIVQHFRTQTGRDVIRIPSYGAIAGQEWENSSRKLFWILWQAGVQVLLVGGTSGITDWRTTAEQIKPGDVVLPWSFRTDPDHRGLPGTEWESVWPMYDVTLNQPFCPPLADKLERLLKPYSDQGLIGKIVTPRDARVALVVPSSITYETDFDILMWQALCKIISDLDPSLPPVVTLHGDCINPIAARLIGGTEYSIHLGYYHMVANFAQGLGKRHGVEILDTLYPLYLGNFAHVALEVEFAFLEQAEIPTRECRCVSDVHLAPEVFNQAMTQPT